MFSKIKISIIPKCDCFHKPFNSPFCSRLNFGNLLLVVVVVKLWNVPEKGASYDLELTAI